MSAPKSPSFFKSSDPKSFSFMPRYYDELKERREKLKRGTKANIRFKRSNTKEGQKVRLVRIIFLIIILSLLTYIIIIN